MRVDPEVNKRKYDRELNRLGDQRTTLESNGIFLMGSSTFPVVELVFLPRHPLRVAVTKTQAGRIVLSQPQLIAAELPSLAARAFKAHLDLSDYDMRAPSLDLRDPWTNDTLSYHTMFRALEFEKVRKAHVVLLPDHPSTHKPFLCLRGIREYHEHPQHSGDDWALYRAKLSLFSIVMSVWRVTIDLIHPQLFPQVDGVKINWAAEEKL